MKIVGFAGVRPKGPYLKLISADPSSNTLVKKTKLIYFIGLPSAMMMIK